LAITGVSQEQYAHYLSNGGTLVFQLEANDIEPGSGFEKSALISPFLDTGFELKPPPLIESPSDAAQLLLRGESWLRVVVFTYRRGGSIVYKRVAAGRYEATVSSPSNG